MEFASLELWPGRPFPLGAHYDGSGTHFSVFSEVADQVVLCLFDNAGTETRVALPEVSGHCWHGYAPGIGPGQRYGYRIHGPFEPEHGHRCNPNKLLLDPYARAITGDVKWGPEVFDYDRSAAEIGETASVADSASRVPLSVVASPFFDWGRDVPPKTPWHTTIIYEVHVKGFTQRLEKVPAHLRGTYAGLAHPATIDYLVELGVTAVELLPIHHFLQDERLVDLGLRNYWGYNSIGYFAPQEDYAASRGKAGQVQEFKQMVKALHEAGIEVILDVVYNHTAEGGRGGPSLCFRGLDNAAYYRLDPSNPREYVDYTGCGNSMNMRHPHVLQLIMDSLRYWVLEMHVDGFRFDLAAALARELHAVDRLSAFFDLIQQDPVLQQVKLIAEPWDIGEGGYQVGNFPPQWSEWNGKFRDTVRDFWRGADQTLAEFAYRFTGSSDLYESSARRPHASINFTTSHDGFTLRDLVSYNEKHNLANGENNRDGDDHNRSWNHGAEGPTDDPDIQALRRRQVRNFLTTLLLSQGVPMLLAGDELGRTQQGNNNAYCQDNELSWINWNDADWDLRDFVSHLIDLRTEHPVFRRRGWFQGRSIRGTVSHDIGWFKPDGSEMGDEDWRVAFAKALGVFLNGKGIASRDERGQPVVDDDFFMIFNAHHGELSFVIPKALGTQPFELLLDTALDAPPKTMDGEIKGGATTKLIGHSMRVWRRSDDAA